jgi:carboxymethylenebutenolidase
MQDRAIDPKDLKTGGYLALPDGKGPHPGVVVIHEAYGLNAHIKDVAGRFAIAGYAALAVDLFGNRNRAICMARFMAGMLRGATDRFGIADLKAALSYLTELPEVDASRVGAVGYCMGGSFAVAWACTDDRLKAIAPYYAVNPRPIVALNRICPVVGSYPANDFTASAGRKLDVELAKRNIEHDIKVYPGARHSFFNDTRGAYDKEAAEDSWQRVLTFFATHLAARQRPRQRQRS